MTASSKIDSRLGGFDGWRGLAIVLVLLSHGSFNTNLASPAWIEFLGNLPRGEDGVRVFFCLSGFLITHLLLKEETREGSISLKAFYARRALRLAPVYFAYIFTVAALSGAFSWGLESMNFVTPATVSTGFWLRRYDTWVFVHLWSVAIEVLFYACWPPLLATLDQRARPWFVGSLLVIIPVLRMTLVGNPSEYFLGFAIIHNTDFLLMGSLAGLFYNPIQSWLATHKPSTVICLQWTGLALFACVWIIHRFGSDWGISGDTSRRFYLGAGFPLIAAGLTLTITTTSLAPASLLTRFLDWAPLSHLGRISYSVYVWQQVILNPSLGEAASWRRFPLNILFAIAAGYISYHCIEKRFPHQNTTSHALSSHEA